MRLTVIALTMLASSAAVADNPEPFIGQGRQGQKIEIEYKVIDTSFNPRDKAEFLKQDTNVWSMLVTVTVRTTEGATTFDSQPCEWSFKYRNVPNRRSKYGYSKDIKRSTFSCQGTSPIAGSEYEARGSSARYVCRTKCNSNPFHVLEKLPEG
jgi:hypothetical protein